MTLTALHPAVLRNAGRPSNARVGVGRSRVVGAILGLAMAALTQFGSSSHAAAVAPAAPPQSQGPAKARTIRMEVTAYCPCRKCCGSNARGVTASGRPVSHNGGRFVAADTRVLPMGSRIVVPGYAAAPVQVIDTGSAIKGNRLDVYFPSHKAALEWGRQVVDVTVID
ncbi:MAG TPA: 3D domain-containing protein [Humisphaera sp.]